MRIFYLSDYFYSGATLRPRATSRAGAGRPMMLGVEDFATQRVSEASAGICIEPAKEEYLLMVLERLTAESDIPERLGASGDEEIVLSYSYDALVSRYLEVPEGACAGVRT